MEITICNDGFLAEARTNEDFEILLRMLFEKEEDEEAEYEYYDDEEVESEDYDEDDIYECARESLGENWW